jgi:SAM-dependent methyltransferase
MEMIIKEIELPIKDFFDKKGIVYENYSILALSVYFANLNYLDETNNKNTLLELGCGSDSVVHNNFKGSWFGIDVVNNDRHGKPTLATNLASVHDMPFQNDFFDNILSNQSIEHWHEYGIDFKMAFSEINRVLKPNGKFTFNFPIHLHGHKIFVLNKLNILEKEIELAGFKISEIRTYKSKKLQPYKGWLKCGFPTIYLRLFSKNFMKTSYVVEYDVEKISKINFEQPQKKSLKIKSRFKKRLHHGFIVVIYNLLKKLNFSNLFYKSA